MSKFDNCSSIHCELKVQYAWEYIMIKYGKRYADKCIPSQNILEHARENPTITVKSLAIFAMMNK